MSVLPESVTRLIEAFAGLPGVGPKSASRLALHLLRQPEQDLGEFSQAIGNLKQGLVICSVCQNIADKTPCRLCSESSRDDHQICVVEDALDVVALEKSGKFKGRYHVLQGVLSPIDGIGPDQLKVAELEKRVRNQDVEEIILATNPTVEGEATALFLTKQIKKISQAKISRLAHGLPVGADLEYADEVTLGQALDGRQEMTATS